MFCCCKKKSQKKPYKPLNRSDQVLKNEPEFKQKNIDGAVARSKYYRGIRGFIAQEDEDLDLLIYDKTIIQQVLKQGSSSRQVSGKNQRLLEEKLWLLKMYFGDEKATPLPPIQNVQKKKKVRSGLYEEKHSLELESMKNVGESDFQVPTYAGGLSSEISRSKVEGEVKRLMSSHKVIYESEESDYKDDGGL